MPISKTIVNIFMLLVLVTGISTVSASQASPEGQYFRETGHWVKGAFLEFYQSSPDPLLLFGFPITDEFDHPIRQGARVQYFQKARMEMDFLVNGDVKISLAPVGSFLYDKTKRGQKADFPITSGACRFFDSGKPVCYAFLQFYDQHSGSNYFGQPISDVEIVDGRLVQYFDYARLEWRPEMPAGQRVALTDVGRLDFDRSVGDPTRTWPSVRSPEKVPTEILVRAFPGKPLLKAGTNQKIFVVVQDQSMQPVAGALVMVSVKMPDGQIKNYNSSQSTNEDGFCEVEVEVDGVKPNQVVEVSVSVNVVNGPDGSAKTWFRIWW